MSRQGIVLMLLFLSGCATNEKTHISPTDLLVLIESGQAPVIIDVRSDSEYRNGHVPGAIHIPFWRAMTTEQLDGIPEQSELILYCAHGPRAGLAKMGLYFTGFENMRYLVGHMTAWEDAGLPMQKPRLEPAAE